MGLIGRAPPKHAAAVRAGFDVFLCLAGAALDLVGNRGFRCQALRSDLVEHGLEFVFRDAGKQYGAVEVGARLAHDASGLGYREGRFARPAHGEIVLQREVRPIGMGVFPRGTGIGHAASAFSFSMSDGSSFPHMAR